jgi:hypothetical protein
MNKIAIARAPKLNSVFTVRRSGAEKAGGDCKCDESRLSTHGPSVTFGSRRRNDHRSGAQRELDPGGPGRRLELSARSSIVFGFVPQSALGR